MFYMKDKEYKDKGLGMLHLKAVDGGKTQMLVRAETNLGNILVSDQMMFKQNKNNVQFSCVPNPEIKGLPAGPTTMLIKVKGAAMAEQLVKKIEELSK